MIILLFLELPNTFDFAPFNYEDWQQLGHFCIVLNLCLFCIRIATAH